MAFEAVRTLTILPTEADAIPRARFVTLTSGKAALTADNGAPIGVTLEASAANDAKAISIAVLDGSRVEVEAHAAISSGARVAVGAAGRAKTGGTSGDRNVGYAENAAGAQGDIITVLVAPEVAAQ